MVNSVAVLTGSDGRPRVVAGSWDHTVKVWDPELSVEEGHAASERHERPLVLAVASPVRSLATDTIPPSPIPLPWFVAGLQDGRVLLLKRHPSHTTE